MPVRARESTIDYHRTMTQRPPFTVAILADTHVRTEPEDPQASYPSDRLHNRRARRAVALAQARNPAFAVHLGDVTHTLPGLSTHGEALRTAQSILGEMSCPVYLAPGNHDVGDKPDSLATAPRVDAASCQAFEKHFGAGWRSWDHGGCHFVTLNAPLFNTGLEEERAQRAWLERDLPGHERIFVFLHYPIYLLHDDEPPHYDNLDQPARDWLLSLVRRYTVEAVFSGHAHNVFLGRCDATELVVAPSTAFVRPEYSELFPVVAADENGRNDRDKLGFLLLHVQERGHRIEFVRSALDEGTWEQPPAPEPTPIGVWLHCDYGRIVELPPGDLDEFRRKRARNDYPLLALRDLGVACVRVPLADLDDAARRDRLAEVAGAGTGIQAFSVGPPTAVQIDLLAAHHGLVDCWELILASDGLGTPFVPAAELPVPLAISRIGQASDGGGAYFSHFPCQGFEVDDPELVTASALHMNVERLVFRVARESSAWGGISAASRRARELGRLAVCHVELPRGDEGRPYTDDRAVARLVAEVLLAASAFPETRVFLDTFEDKDRGYYPRHGVFDRRGNPRDAARVVRNLGRLLHGQRPSRLDTPGQFELSAGVMVLDPGGDAPGDTWLDLVTGRRRTSSPLGPAIRLSGGGLERRGTR